MKKSTRTKTRHVPMLVFSDKRQRQCSWMARAVLYELVGHLPACGVGPVRHGKLGVTAGELDAALQELESAGLAVRRGRFVELPLMVAAVPDKGGLRQQLEQQRAAMEAERVAETSEGAADWALKLHAELKALGIRCYMTPSVLERVLAGAVAELGARFVVSIVLADAVHFAETKHFDGTRWRIEPVLAQLFRLGRTAVPGANVAAAAAEPFVPDEEPLVFVNASGEPREPWVQPEPEVDYLLLDGEVR